MTPPPQPPPKPTWRAHAVALFVTAHLVCVTLYALPRPPALNKEILEHPEVKTELEHSFRTLHNIFPWRDTPQAMQDDILNVVRAYTRATDKIRAVISPYLEAAGSTQSWHMLGGTPPRFPLVFVVEVQPRGEGQYVLFQDLYWGTEDSRAMNFRHRKAQELLSAYGGPSDWTAYAAYWARRWDERHPERPARRVRLSNRRLHTPDPAEVRRGVFADRHPEDGIQTFVWERGS
jgi:hypothetical protein